MLFRSTIFAMPFALIGFFLGLISTGSIVPGGHNKTSSLQFDKGTIGLKFLLVIICMITARSAAMAFNRYLDRAIDAKNPRTAIREIPAGVISAKNALLFTILSCLLFVLAAWFINPICFFLSPAALAVILGYSYTKRFTPLCHLVLGVGLSLAPIGAYLAVAGEFNILPLFFSFVVISSSSSSKIFVAVRFDDCCCCYSNTSQKTFSTPQANATNFLLDHPAKHFQQKE